LKESLKYIGRIESEILRYYMEPDRVPRDVVFAWLRILRKKVQEDLNERSGG